MASIQQEQATAGRREKLEDLLVVDVDVHVKESPAEMAHYIDMPWRKSLEVITNSAARLSPAFGGVIAPFPGGAGGRRVQTAAQMREELSALSIDIGVLFPEDLLTLAVLPQADYAAALARAYNAWLIDRWCLRERGLLGCLIAAPQAPEDAAREIARYAKEPGIVGVYLPTAGIDPLWGDRKYEPIYQAAQDADLPLLLHTVTIIHPVFPCQLHQFDTQMARHAISHPFSMIANLINIVTTGVQVRYPKLRIAFTEAGVSWVPFVMWRLDKEYIERRREVPFLEHPPSHYVKQFHFATQPVEEPEHPKDLVTLMQIADGENTTMFASDWPHHDFDHPSKIYQLPFSPEARRKVLGENALRFFKIDAQGRRLDQ